MSVINTILKELNLIFLPIERIISQQLGENGILKYPPVFIIGAPRTGTTLLYKLLIEVLNLSYMSNLNAYFFRLPIVSSYLFNRLIQNSYNKEYESDFGFIPGLGSPSENGEFWYQWFPKGKNIYVAPQQTPDNKLLQLRQAIGGFSYIHGFSTVFKNVYNSMRIAPILEAMPNACFIICKREYSEIALSIYNARKQNMGDHHQWWSVPPKEIDKLLKLDFAEQIAGQIYYIYKQISTDMERYGEDKFLEIKYEDLCQNVPFTIDIIKYFFKKKGISIEDNVAVPKNFKIGKTINSNEIEQKKLLFAIDSYFKLNYKINEQQRKI